MKVKNVKAMKKLIRMAQYESQYNNENYYARNLLAKYETVKPKLFNQTKHFRQVIGFTW